LVDPRSVVPESVMPPYAFLAEAEINSDQMADHLRVNRMLRVPYTDEQLTNASIDAAAQAEPMGDHAFDFEQRYPGVAARDFDGDPTRVTEMDALIAYLQMLGTGVDFETYQAEAPENLR
jgi:cytochrome c oxidase cbb3-type subunit 2